MPKVRQRNAHEHNHFRKALEEIPRVRKLQLQQQEGGTKEMKFHIIKREESSISPAFDGVMEFDNVEDFLNWANYHRAYITDIKGEK